MRALQGLGSAIVVSSVFCLFLVGLLGATLPFAIGSGVVLGLGIVAVVATIEPASSHGCALRGSSRPPGRTWRE